MSGPSGLGDQKFVENRLYTAEVGLKGEMPGTTPADQKASEGLNGRDVSSGGG